MTTSSTPSPIVEDGAEPPAPDSSGPPHPGITLAIIAVCQLMIILDATIVNVALPDVQKDLSFSGSDLSWVLNAYALTFGGLLLLGGRFGDILGRRKVFVIGVAVFTGASLLGGVTPNGGLLLLARALQGVGAALAAPGTLALIATNFPEGKARTKAMGVYGGVTGSGAALGLILGGVLTDTASWRWVFFVNIPFGILIAVLSPRYVRESERNPGRFDLLGALTSTGGMALLVYGFINAGSKSWGDTSTLACFAGAVVLLGAFLLVETRAAQPILPLRLFRDRDRTILLGAMLFLSGNLAGMFFFLTQFVQEVMKFSPIKAGFGFVPVAFSLIAAAGVVMKVLTKVGAKPLMLTGAVLVTGGMVWLAQLQADSGYLTGLFGPMVLIGVGAGFFIVPLNIIAVAGVEQEDAGAASSLLNVVTQVGSALGLAILVTVFSSTVKDETAHPPTDVAAADFPAHLLAVGSSAAFWVGAGLAVVAVVAALVARSREVPDDPAAVLTAVH
ncbi:MFS transporter [Kitasatospora sp. NPDC101183]|uniref:MFS transporter n=1 Tax=Kitasatospora sp. NPDC101183 TaxID=3364100 RepID=UPI00382CC0C2